MLRQDVYCVRIPERRRAISIPSKSPETTIERAVARLCGGARSPTRGSINCGVTVETAVMKDIARKTENEFVRHKPSHLIISAKAFLQSDRVQTIVAVKNIRMSTNARRRNMSPSGHRNSSPAAYPPCITVGICAACSLETLNSTARMFKMGWL